MSNQTLTGLKLGEPLLACSYFKGADAVLTAQVAVNVSFNPSLIGKPKRGVTHAGFAPCALTLAGLVERVTVNGEAFGVVCDGDTAKAETFQRADVLAVDFDAAGVAKVSAHPVVKAYAFLVYATPSSTPQAPRARAVFRLEEPIQDVKTYRCVYRKLLAAVAELSPDGKAAGFLFYGNQTAEMWTALENVLPLDLLPDLQQSTLERVPVDGRAEQSPLTDNGLHALYANYCRTLEGRNRALFNTACVARDSGWQQQTVIDQLLSEFVNTPALGQHKPETPHERAQEGLKAIKSAFSRAPRTTRQLSNASREALLKSDFPDAARLLDAVFILDAAGFRAGDDVSASSLLKLFKATGVQVGINNVNRLLKNFYLDCHTNKGTLFALACMSDSGDRKCSPETSKSKSEVACPEGVSDGEAGCSTSKKRGRPSHLYRTPSPEAVARMLGVDSVLGDRLALKDVGKMNGTDGYKDALQLAIVEREQRQASQAGEQTPARSAAWYAARLGCSKRTVWRMAQRQHIVTQPVYVEVARLLDGNDIALSLAGNLADLKTPEYAALARGMLVIRTDDLQQLHQAPDTVRKYAPISNNALYAHHGKHKLSLMKCVGSRWERKAD
jgi:hypothetical protein